MRKSIRLLVVVVPVTVTLALAQNQPPPQKPLMPQSQPAQEKPTSQPPAPDLPSSPLDFVMKTIDGKEFALDSYRGDVVLIVNVASKCGNTPQYVQLEQLYKKYKDRGLRIAAFPANNFRGQEPGRNEEIKQFCQDQYGVTFDLFAKISVKGEDQAKLYQYLTSKEKNGEFGGEIAWNFTKFLVGRDGKVIARFEPKVRPDDPDVVKAVEAALAAPKPGRSKPRATDGK